MNGTTLLGQVSLSNGKATLSTSTLAAATYSVTAVYNSNLNFTPVTSSAVAQQVNAATTSASLSNSASGPVVYGTLITYTATMTNTSGTTPLPSGWVTFYLDYNPSASNNISLGLASLSAGVAKLTTQRTPGGTHTITAVFAGTTNFVGSTSNSVSQTVNPAPTQTVLSVAPGTSVAFGTTVTFTATVTDSLLGAVASGMVQFFDGTTLLATVGVSKGIASFATKALAMGPHSIKAVYLATSNDQGSTSAVITETVT
jgi:hypothetical protein